MFVFQFVLQILTACMFSKSGSKSLLVCSKKKIVYIMELLIFEELIMSRKFKYKLCFFHSMNEFDENRLLHRLLSKVQKNL